MDMLEYMCFDTRAAASAMRRPDGTGTDWQREPDAHHDLGGIILIIEYEVRKQQYSLTHLRSRKTHSGFPYRRFPRAQDPAMTESAPDRGGSWSRTQLIVRQSLNGSRSGQ